MLFSNWELIESEEVGGGMVNHIFAVDFESGPSGVAVVNPDEHEAWVYLNEGDYENGFDPRYVHHISDSDIAMMLANH